LIALEVDQGREQTAVITLAMHKANVTRENRGVARCASSSPMPAPTSSG
jgi:hypothetical protein